MTLGFYSNWEMNHLNSILGPIYDNQSEVAEALIGFLDPTVDIPIDSLFDTQSSTNDHLFDNCYYAEIMSSNSNLLPCYSDPSIFTLPSKLHPEFDCCKCPKRPRSCSDLYRPPSVAYNGPYVVRPADFVVPPPPPPPMEAKKGSGCLSAQSMAARERRKRISEKTQELGRLIPGGNKMNTAEMFQAAFKYVKFLQAQVGILGVMGSLRGSKSSSEVDQQLQVLVTSPTIQEKLYSEGKCIVSTQAVEALAEEAEIKSAPVISRDLNRFVHPMG